MPKQTRQVGKGVTTEKPYIYELKRQRVFAKNKATDTTYQVKFNEKWQGDQLKDLTKNLHEMFDEILDKFVEIRRIW